MGSLCLGSCAIVLLLMYTQRRDRWLLARLPLFGAGALCVAIGVYTLYRVSLAPGAITLEDGTVVRAILAAASGFAMPLIVPWGRALLRQDLPRLGRKLCADPVWTGACLLAGLLTAAAYFSFGRELNVRDVFGWIDRLVDADPLYQQTGWGVAIHTQTHPLLPSLWFVALKVVVPLAGAEWAPLLITCAIGGLCVSLAAVYFRAVTGSRVLGLLAALILGSTASHIIFGAMPESYILSAAALILLQLTFTGQRTIRRRHVVLAAMLAVGVATLNVVPAMICLALWRPPRRRWVATVTRGAQAMVIGGCLLSLQLTLHPKAEPFQPRLLFGEKRFVRATPSSQLAFNVLHGVSLQNVVGWKPVDGATLHLPGVRAGDRYEPLGAVVGIAWGGVAIGAAWLILRRRLWRERTFGVAMLCFLAAVATYTPVAQESTFLYSCCFTFFACAVLAHGLRGVRSRAAPLVLGGFLVLLVVNNARFCAQIVEMIDRIRQRSA